MTELEEIKNRLDIVEYIGKYVPLKQAGRNHKGLCPFHNEKTGSFMVNSEKQIYHCFGCGKGGDIFSFVQEIEGVDFPTALKELADKAGVKLPERANFRKEPTDILYEISEQACQLYEKELHSPANKSVLNYLHDRGMTDETIKLYRLGFAPQSGDIVVKDLIKTGFTKEDLIKAGVAKERNERFLDQFFNRITFPITNPSGKVVAFTARVLDNSLPKYINTPETPIYHKSSILFNFDKAKEQIRKQDHVIVVEGQMDAIFSYQAGVKNVVASSGTALTETQLDLIKRFTKNIKMSFDVDNAGQIATRRAIELAWAREYNIKVISVPEGKDPADLVKSDPKKWVKACREAKYVVDYIFDSTFARYDLGNILHKKAATKELLGWISKLPDIVEREHYLNLLGAKVGVSVASLTDALAKVSKTASTRRETAPEKPVAKEKTGKSREEHALAMLLIVPTYVEFFFNKLSVADFTEENVKKFVTDIKDIYDKTEKFDESAWEKNLSETDSSYIKKLIILTEDELAEANDELLSEELFYSVMRVKTDSLDRKKKTVSARLAAAEKGGDKKLQTELLTEFQKIINEERNL